MAQVVTDGINVVETWRPWLVSAGIGVGLGLLWWVLAALISRYIIDPIACRDIATAATCINSGSIAGNISAVLTALAGIFLLVRFDLARPIIVAGGTVAILWSLAAWLDGLFWLEAIGWSLLLYGLSYALFAWIARADRLWVSLVVTVVVIAVVIVATLI